VPSPDDAWVVFTSRDNVYVARAPRHPHEGAARGRAEGGRGSGLSPLRRRGRIRALADRGKTITWALGNTFYRLPLQARSTSRASSAEGRGEGEEGRGEEGAAPESEKDKEKKEQEKIQDARVPKAQTIPIALSMPRPVPSGSFVLRGARVATMKGDEVLPNADVVVTDNRIAARRAHGHRPVPAGARILDATGETVIPGFIDTHAHLHYSGSSCSPRRSGSTSRTSPTA
jgi:hypothetical protein